MNNADTIEGTLRDLIEQARQPDRIIVVDASTDKTPDLVRDVAATTDIRIDCYEQSDDGRGVGRARQDIYEHFDGDLLACVDTDIRLADDWLQCRAEFHREHPEYDILSAAPMEGLDGPVNDPKRGYFFQQANCSIRSEALDRVDGWDPWFPRGEDWDMQIRLWRSGAESYVQSALHGEPCGREESAIQKSLDRPSSVAFVRKYGTWYLRFHPEHVAGDAASLYSLIATAALPLMFVVQPVLSATVFLSVFALSIVFVYMKNQRHRAGFDVRRSDLVDFIRFFVLGYTALRELKAGDRPWNYGGLDRSGES